MNTQQLQCFICVADKLNFTKAAEELYLTTPTVTHHIQKLEEELGVSLFIRSSRSVHLTEAGSAFYTDAKEIMLKLELSRKRISKLAVSRPLSIGFTSSIELSQLSQSLSALRQKYPEIHPEIIVDDYFKLTNMFNNHQLDIFFCTHEMLKELRHYHFSKLRTATIYAIVTSDSPLASLNTVIPDDLESFCIISLSPRSVPFHRNNSLQHFFSQHLRSHGDFVCENDQSALTLASAGYGVAILPDIYIPSTLENVVCVPLDGSNVDYGLAFQEDAPDSWADFFINTIR